MIKSFDIQKGDVITITGAGGKTSLIFSLAKKLSKFGKVLITTTTKMFVPKLEEFEEMVISEKKVKGLEKNIFIYGKSIEDNKLLSLSFEEILKLKENFDFILIEGDGAKRKKIKAWNETEPCIPNFSTKVIGVVNLDIVFLELIEENIHRYELFCELFKKFLGKSINSDFLIEYIKKGNFFKNFFFGEKYIFFNGIDGKDYLEKFSIALEVCNKLNYNYKIVLGSIKENNFFKFIPTDAIVMASGFSKRMRSNKLLLLYKNKTILDYTFEKLLKIPFLNIYVCGREEWVKKLSEKYKFIYLENKKAELGQSESIKLGMRNSAGEGVVFFTGDQPLLTIEIILKLYYNFQKNNGITIPKVDNKRFSPVFFPENKKNELLNIDGDVGGREVIKNSSILYFVDFKNEIEFKDIDTPEDYELLVKNEF